MAQLPRFDLVIVLRLDARTQARRLADPSRANDFGRIGETAAWSNDYRVRLEAELLAAGALSTDATRPLDLVVDDVLGLCAEHGMPLALG